ncbi:MULTISPECIES: hypothetical protein [Pseudoalteromonas]|uniref:Uncharacterized protein n=1 Tax=Pseudoalteromonas carrageenovora IAM 12662 TaxID=1314868 RepID=A0A2K4X6N6_PSEVC|nr:MULTISPECIES: hypothetical protein [Pseudoalteromonas]KTF17345.1 hypothetical protein ATS74_01140 [Pseudoalteromonas sp. H103]MBE0382201.1 hypothetical protein [Pseudoalteromonas carrageenovora IAM 12662]MDO6462700.1 hypothetical protein [Pseudoalteromonas carrageenovora]MDO6546692.1 hypothetical protein [Pseudoalteromonas carrageenovora]MDO6634631.1 hypothetical protein [Pseudoalteromonas carrageenovora]
MNIEYPLIALLGAFLTFYLAKHNRFDGIRASASLSIIAYLILSALNLNPNLYSVVFFGGTFIGMSAPHRFGIYTVASSSILFSLLFEYLVPKLDGYGGALGISAFLSVCICHMCILLGAPRSKKPTPK